MGVEEAKPLFEKRCFWCQLLEVEHEKVAPYVLETRGIDRVINEAISEVVGAFLGKKPPLH